MSLPQPAGSPPVARLREVSLRFGRTLALDRLTLDLPAGCMVGVIGPDGVGKSSLFSLIAGARKLQSGSIEVLGGDIADAAHRDAVQSRIAYMPQGLGKNLYPTLSVFENVDFFAGLFGYARRERRQRITRLLQATGLAPFSDRPAGKLSGGMRQKLGLCCALVHDPDLLILDEPTTGVDPLSRRQFWQLIDRIRSERPGMSLLIATAYMDEAARFDWLLAMDRGTVLGAGTPRELLARSGSETLEEAFVRMLPGGQGTGYRPVEVEPRAAGAGEEIAIEARELTMRFGDFTAVDHVSFRIRRGEIFGFVGSNGCGKTTTMKMLTGLLPASDGQAWLLGRPVDPHDVDRRRQIGYMTQSFSLYGELTVRQNLVIHAQLFGMPAQAIEARVAALAKRFDLVGVMDQLPQALPLGRRQRLSLAVAMIHQPEILILDEPTSGVDPMARDDFWRTMIELARRDNVTIFISTHFMNEAGRCDRIALMHAGRVLVSDSPAAIVAERKASGLEEAFIGHLQQAMAHGKPDGDDPPEQPSSLAAAQAGRSPGAGLGRDGLLSLRRFLSCARRELLELSRDPIRVALAVLGSILLMLVLGFGINMDVEDVTLAVLDRDQTDSSHDYAMSLASSRYFIGQPPISDYADMDRRMRAGETSVAVEIPQGFGRDIARGNDVQIGVWIDGAMPARAETMRSYLQGVHQQWLATRARAGSAVEARASPAVVETRFRYNPDVATLPAMVPAVIPLLLFMIPAALSALAVVREKELGSIVNLYVTPVRRLEFLLGKQLPYIGLGMFNFLLLVALAVWLFGVPHKGSFLALTVAALLYVTATTAFGLLVSTFVRSQVAALFGTLVLSMPPVVQFSGLVEPVSSLAGPAQFIGSIFPTSHFLNIARGTFSKGLDAADLAASFLPLAISVPVLIGLGAALLRKQER